MELKEQNRLVLNAAKPLVPDGGGRRSKRQVPLIALALDRSLYPEWLHQKISANPECARGLSWLHALYYIRKYYDESNGQHYNPALQGSVYPSDGSLKSVILTRALSVSVNRDQEWERLQPHEHIQAECWLVRSVEAGHTGKMMGGMRFLCDRLYHGFTSDALDSALSALEGQPLADNGLIEASKMYREWFHDSIEYLISGEGQGWLESLAAHPIRARYRAPRWGLHLNGRKVVIAMEIRSRSREVTIKQGNLHIQRSTSRDSCVVPMEDLLRAGFNTESAIGTTCGQTEFPDLRDVLFTCESRSGSFNPFIGRHNEDVVVARQAACLLAIIPANVRGSFTLGGMPVPSAFGRLANNNDYQVVRLDFSNFDRSDPLDLCFSGGAPLLRIGGAPWLRPVRGEDDFRVEEDPDAWVVFGDATEIIVEDLYGQTTGIEWRGAEEIKDGTKVLKCGQSEWGTKKTASIKVPGKSYPITVGVIFLPEELRKAMLVEESASHSGIQWIPESNSDRVQVKVESVGLCPGKIKSPVVELSVLVPSRVPHFWCYQGVNQVGQFDQPFQFASLEACRNLRIDFYLPPGSHSVSWDEKNIFEVQGHGFFSLQFEDIRSTESSSSDHERVLELMPEAGNPMTVITCEAGPRVIPCGGGFQIVLPRAADVDAWQFAVILEGARGFRVLETGSCADLLASADAPSSGVAVSGPNIGAGPGAAAVVVWSSGVSFGCLWEAIHRPAGVHGPFPIRDGNPFLSASGIGVALGGQFEGEIPIPDWMGALWKPRRQDQPWEESHFEIMHSLKEIWADKRPEEIWVPCEAFQVGVGAGSIGQLQALERDRIRADGEWFRLRIDPSRVGTLWCPRTLRTVPFEWVLEPDECDWSRFPAPPNPRVPETWQIGSTAVLEVFSRCLEEARPLIGAVEDGRLAWFFDYLNNWLGSEEFHPGRGILFQVAVIERLSKRLGEAAFLDGEARDIVAGVKGLAYSSRELRRCLTRDLLTVEWLLHWFREWKGAEDQRIDPPCFPTQTHLTGLFDWLQNSVVPWFADPVFGPGRAEGAPSFVELLAEAMEAFSGVEGVQPAEFDRARQMLRDMASVSRCEKPDEVWLQDSWFRRPRANLDPLGKVDVGWVFNQNADYPRVDFDPGGKAASLPALREAKVISGAFDATTGASRTLLGEPGNRSHLAFVYRCLASWLRSGNGRQSSRLVIFQLAVLCRLRAWSVRETDNELDQSIRECCLVIWQSSDAQKLFISDLVTVDWTLWRLSGPALRQLHRVPT